MMICPTCGHEVSTAGAASYLGLTVSLIVRCIEWHGRQEITQPTFTQMKMLHALANGGLRGARKSAMEMLYGGQAPKTLAVHLSNVRNWIKENELPLAIVFIEGSYRLVKT